MSKNAFFFILSSFYHFFIAKNIADLAKSEFNEWKRLFCVFLFTGSIYLTRKCFLIDFSWNFPRNIEKHTWRVEISRWCWGQNLPGFLFFAILYNVLARARSSFANVYKFRKIRGTARIDRRNEGIKRERVNDFWIRRANEFPNKSMSQIYLKKKKELRVPCTDFARNNSPLFDRAKLK